MCQLLESALNYSKLDNFGRKKLKITRAIFWCQKLPKINIHLTLFLFFDFFPKNFTFQTFSLEVPKSSVKPSPIIPKSTQLN